MQKKPTHSESDVIACEVCLKEIPRDLAKTDAATEYVHYFCGEHCFAEWKAGADKPDVPKTPER